jgi:hypothetical protein
VFISEVFLFLARSEVFTAVAMKNGVFWDVRRVDVLRTDVSEERSASIKVTGIGDN